MNAILKSSLKIYSIITLFYFSFTSCVNEIEIEFPNHSPQLVLNALIAKDSVVTFSLTASSLVNTVPSGTVIPDSIRCFENGIEVFPAIILNGDVYKTNWIAKTGVTLGIHIDAHGYQSIDAEDCVPQQISFEDLKYKKNVGVTTDGTLYSSNKFTINDTFSEENFFEIYMSEILTNGEYSQLDVWGDDNVVYLSEGDNSFYYNKLVFSDQHFYDTKIDLICYFNATTDNLLDGIIDQLFVRYRTVSKNYYMYKKSLMRHNYYLEDGDLWKGMGVPVDLYTNIKGGLGIFACYAQQYEYVKYEDFE